MACRYQRNANTLYSNEQFIYACSYTHAHKVAYCKKCLIGKLKHKCMSTSMSFSVWPKTSSRQTFFYLPNIPIEMTDTTFFIIFFFTYNCQCKFCLECRNISVFKEYE